MLSYILIFSKSSFVGKYLDSANIFICRPAIRPKAERLRKEKESADERARAFADLAAGKEARWMPPASTVVLNRIHPRA